MKKSIRMDWELFLWSDSKKVLSWLRKSPQQLNVYVANRVSKILQLTCDATWYYVPTKLNPADVISRGRNPDELIDNNL